jgi:hypothetical protein
MADWLDNEAIAQRTRDRILGHASDVRGRYGRKGVLDPGIAAQIEAFEPPVIKKIKKVLLAAKEPRGRWRPRRAQDVLSFRYSALGFVVWAGALKLLGLLP